MDRNRTRIKNRTGTLLAVAATLLAATALTGCVVVGGSSTGGWFIWPGGLGLLVIILIAIFLMRGRR